MLSSDICELRPISSERLFFYTIIITHDVILQPPQSQLPPSLRNIIGRGEIRDISVTQLSSAALWLLTGFVKFSDTSAPATRREMNATDSVSLTNPEKGTRATCFRNTHAKPEATADSDGNSDDGHYSMNELNNDDDSNGQDSDLDDTAKG